MSVWILVIAALVLTVAGAMRARRRRHPRSRIATVTATDSDVPTFRVVALGPRGSGKTLLLASMYQQMQTESGRSYLLTAPFEDVVLLNQWFASVADTSLDWPAGTAVGETREFLFTVQTRATSGALHPVMRLGYLDYAGGLLTDAQLPGATSRTDLLGHINRAHALVGIIDGNRIRQCLEGRVEGLMGLQQSLTAMIGLMITASCPITFVITKWDLLRDLDVDEDARLRQVRKFLMSNAGFRDLVQAHSVHRVVRLIPVSAVGPDFAEVGPAGQVTKLPDGQLHPTNVDVPLAGVVPDLFEQVERSIDRSELQAALDRVHRRSRPGPAAALAELGSYVATTAGRMLGALSPYAGFVGDAALELFGSAEHGQDERWQRLDRELSEADRGIEEARLARRRVLREFQSRIDVLEGRLPSSRLSRED
jgi:hypothetical protein